MKALKKMTSCNDLRKKICTGSSKTFLRYPGNPSQITRSCNSSFINLLLGSLQNSFLCVPDLKVICAQSWGHIEPLWNLRNSKSSSQYTIASFLCPNRMKHTVLFIHLELEAGWILCRVILLQSRRLNTWSPPAQSGKARGGWVWSLGWPALYFRITLFFMTLTSAATWCPWYPPWNGLRNKRGRQIYILSLRKLCTMTDVDKIFNKI